MRMRVLSLALPSGLRIWHCCRLQMQLGSGVAVTVAVAGTYSTPRLGTFIYHQCGPKKDKRPKKKKKKKENIFHLIIHSKIIIEYYNQVPGTRWGFRVHWWAEQKKGFPPTGLQASTGNRHLTNNHTKVNNLAHQVKEIITVLWEEEQINRDQAILRNWYLTEDDSCI